MYISDMLAQGNFNTWGRNTVIGTALEDFMGLDIAVDLTQVFNVAYAIDFASTSANDTAAGSGAQMIRIFGLDGNYNFQIEDLATNGQTKVVGVKTFLRVFGVEVIRAGSGKMNAGDLYFVKTTTGGTFTAGVPATLTSGVARMLPGWGACLTGLFTVPAGQMWIVEKVLISGRAQAGTHVLQVQDLGDPVDNSVKTLYAVEVSASSTVQIKLGIAVNEKCDIRMRALAVASQIGSVGMKLSRQK